jgi:hypothetical protein
MIDARTTRVLGALVAAMTLGALFLMAIEQAPPRLNPASMRPAVLNDRSFELSKQWERVVVHTSKGGGDSLPMRCHFIVRRSADANGQWVDRTRLWQLQEPGQHLYLPGVGFNTRSIGICVMTDGEADTMSRQQFEALVSLVQGLQRDLGISASGVCLRNELPGGTGMMRSFPAEEFETRLLRQVK